MTISSAEEFVRLSDSDNREDRTLSSNGSASLEVWYEVIANYPEYRQWVAHNKTVPLEILDELAQDSDADVRRWVAMKRKLSPQLFERLARDPDSSVRNTVAYNAKVPQHLLEILSQDSEKWLADNAQGRLARRRTNENR